MPLQHYSPTTLQFSVFSTHQAGISLHQEELRELPQSITVSVTYNFIFTVSFIIRIIKIILRTNNLWANLAVR